MLKNMGLELPITLDRVQKATSDFDLNPQFAPHAPKLRPASVLVGLIKRDIWRVILTKRTAALVHHPGQVAFPGGKRDAHEDAQTAALREADEEIGLRSQLVGDMLELAPHQTVTGFEVTPFLACISDEFSANPNPGEVAEVFEVPLSHVMDRTRYRVETRLWGNQKRSYNTVPFGPYYIWGASASILRSIAENASFKL